MPSFDAHDLVNEIGEDWPGFDDIELEEEFDDDSPDAA